MTKKHSIALADYIKDTHNYCEPFTLNQVEHLANYLHSQNPRFDRGRWISYIQGENGPNGRKSKK